MGRVGALPRSAVDGRLRPVNVPVMRTVLACLWLALLASCATVPSQTKLMEEKGVKVSSAALRDRLRAEAVPFTGLMEQAADSVAAMTADPAVYRRALVWKINVVPALYRSLFAQRPVVALVDTWGLLIQAEDYLRSSEGAESFGAGAADLLATTRELEGRVEEIARWAAPERDMGKVRAALEAWARQHPVRLTFATRDGVDQYLATVTPTEELGAFAAVGAMNEDIDGLVARMDFLPVLVPRQATWQAELTYVDLIAPRLDAALHRGGEALGKFDAMLAWLGTEGLDGFAGQQRVQLVRAMDVERVEVERLLERQRLAVQAFVEAERVALIEQVRQERVAATADLARLTEHAADEAARRAREVIDHVLIRVGLLLGALLVIAIAGAWLVRGRGRTAMPPAA